MTDGDRTITREERVNNILAHVNTIKHEIGLIVKELLSIYNNRQPDEWKYNIYKTNKILKIRDRLFKDISKSINKLSKIVDRDI